MTQPTTSSDSWEILRRYTDARIALGRTGASLTTQQVLSLNEAHAHARDSIYQQFAKNKIEDALQQLHQEVIQLKSNVSSKKEFLLRPDLGRRLSDESIADIQETACKKTSDVCISISDGLSATAVNNHAIPLLKRLIEKLHAVHLTIAPICIIENGRVAISDETGSLFNAQVSVILIGERPGLSAADSMGVYVTYGPKPGNTDEQRNCVSNIRRGGLTYEAAVTETLSLITTSIRLKLSGTLLKTHLSLTENQ